MKTLFSTVFLLLPALTYAQVPVDENGNVIGNYESSAEIMPIGDDGIPRLSTTELQELVGPIALYPDDLLAIVLPASAYPLQIVEASRFLEALKSDPTLKPDPNWDDSIVALINYPEVVELLNEDLDWTWRLGEAVVAQQSDVVGAVETFRDRAYAAGNLKTDSYQTVARNDGVINISPASEEVIYVPYYEPTRVVHYQPRPVYYYYPQPYPVYYYPYSAGHFFDRGFFWGVTTAFSIGWMSDSLHVYHHSYRGHPYYGRSYWNDRWYRRPSINVYNTTYVNNSTVTVNRYSNGDRWRPRTTRREYVRREGYQQNSVRQRNQTSTASVSRTRQQEPIAFRERNSQLNTRTSTRQSPSTTRRASERQDAIEDARERQRDNTYRVKQRTTREQQPSVSRSSVNRSSVDRSKKQATPVKVYQEQVRRTREQAPARTQRATAPSQRSQARTERAPARAERAPNRSEAVRSAQRSQKQSSRSQASRAPSRKKSSGSSKKSERKSNERRSRSRDRQQR